MRYVSNTTTPELARRILAAQRIMVTSHVKPDGDAIGSILALVRALAAKGKIIHGYLMGPVEPNLLKIAEPTPLRRLDGENAQPPEEYDLIIIADTGAWSQLEPIRKWLRDRHERIIGIDHHSRGDDVASLRLIDPKAVSTTALILPLLDEMRCDIAEGAGDGGVGGIAEALFVGLATDSGWFRYDNADADAFRMAARLIEAGVNKSRLYQILEEGFGPQRLALEARALASLEYLRDGAVAVQMLGMQDFKAAGASAEDVTGLVNTPMTVGAVRVSVLLTQTSPGVTKISFRSKPAAPDAAPDDFVNVNDLASRFGGGGHMHAAGARVNLEIEQARAAVLAVLREVR